MSGHKAPAEAPNHDPADESVVGTTENPEDATIAPTSSEPPPAPELLSEQCSGYFVQPLGWMSFLEQGDATGKIACPNEKCGAKLGNYDWTGVKCSCGQWVTPVR